MFLFHKKKIEIDKYKNKHERKFLSVEFQKNFATSDQCNLTSDL